MAKLIEDATGPVLEEHLEGLSHQDLVEDSLVSLIFCDHSGDVKDNSTDYRDLPKIRIPHVAELMVERMSSIENLPSEQRNKELPDYKNKSSDDNFVRGTMMLFRFAEVGERPMDGHEDIAYSREKRNNVLRFASLKTRIRETTIKAAREKGIDYVKYLNTVDKPTRIIVTREGRLGLAPSAPRAGDVVAIIQGARAPFILRRCDNGRRHKIVSQAYIRGLMNGEALERRGFALEDFLVN